jgi:hypothetical protein
MKRFTLSFWIWSLLLIGGAWGQSLITNPVGFSTVTLPAGSAVVVPSFVNAPSFIGNAVIATSGLTVTPSVNPSWTTNAFAETNFTDGRPNYPTCYVEVQSGTYEGYCFDIVSNTSSALTIPAASIPSALQGQTVPIAVRKHVTLDSLLVGSSGFQDYADGLSIHNDDGSTSVRFYVSHAWVAEDFATAAGQTVIYPGSGIVFTTTQGANLVLTGTVKTTKTAVPLYKAAVNYIGPLNPAADTNLLTLNIVTALAPYADGFTTLTATGNLQTISAYFSDGTSLLDRNFVPLPPTAPDVVQENRGIVVTVTANTVWIYNSPWTP